MSKRDVRIYKTMQAEQKQYQLKPSKELLEPEQKLLYVMLIAFLAFILGVK